MDTVEMSISQMRDISARETGVRRCVQRPYARDGVEV